MYATANGATVVKPEIRERRERERRGGGGDYQLHTAEISLASMERLTISLSTTWKV